MNEQELKGIEQVFTIARKAIAEDKNQCIAILNLEDKLFKHLKDGKPNKPARGKGDN